MTPKMKIKPVTLDADTIRIVQTKAEDYENNFSMALRQIVKEWRQAKAASQPKRFNRPGG